ncbi:hypothetical protein [Neobacillus mesonae]|uniref:Uncharacterized protein n=1 Tax=Neobacillus mesonae TaxID=1193713 RepID=A0A3T0HZM3_9BACI|nr:hypothetical protein [Neobacillus mesonae]AZU62601.1 hypothetical protein CHR53_15745 [Neobacillus mesonae]
MVAGCKWNHHYSYKGGSNAVLMANKLAEERWDIKKVLICSFLKIVVLGFPDKLAGFADKI